MSEIVNSSGAIRVLVAVEEYPFASHLLYTQENILDDSDPVERTLGIVSGFAFAKLCDKTVIYADLGISNGMMLGIEKNS